MSAGRRWDGEAGTGLVGTLAAVVVFLSFVLLASHVLVALYARSVVNAAGYDAARVVASRSVDHSDPTAVAGAERRAEARLRRLLGRMGDDAQVSWQVRPDRVSLRLHVPVPAVGVPGGLRPSGLEVVNRSFTVRIEELR